MTDTFKTLLDAHEEIVGDRWNPHAPNWGLTSDDYKSSRAKVEEAASRREPGWTEEELAEAIGELDTDDNMKGPPILLRHMLMRHTLKAIARIALSRPSPPEGERVVEGIVRGGGEYWTVECDNGQGGFFYYALMRGDWSHMDGHRVRVVIERVGEKGVERG